MYEPFSPSPFAAILVLPIFIYHYSKSFLFSLSQALLVTREFEPQTSRLTGQDFAHWAALLAATDALGLYNSDFTSGKFSKNCLAYDVLFVFVNGSFNTHVHL